MDDSQMDEFPPTNPPLDVPPVPEGAEPALPMVDPEEITPVMAPPITFEQMKSNRVNQFNLLAQQAGADYLVTYPDLEKLTWPQQVMEANRWRADPNSGPFPVCQAINNRRGLDFSEFMERTATKIEAFQRVAGLIIGERQRLEDAISALTEDSLENRNALNALTWTVTQDDIDAALAGS